MSIPSFDTTQSVTMVTGAYPPDVCGVGDYTNRLMRAAPSHWQLLFEKDWSLRRAPQILRRLLNKQPSTVIIQYPTQGYRWSLVPHLIAVFGKVTLRYRSILALHEFSSLSLKAKLALSLTSHFVAHIIFTTEAERDFALANRFFASKVGTSVIGILSNIPGTKPPPPLASRGTDIAYFGHIRPNKGIEDFLDVISAFRRVEASARIAVIGEVPAGYEGFGHMVETRCQEIDFALIRDLDDTAAGLMLADVKILYLPFRDGVSARRGTALAGLSNGTLLATRIGAATPNTMLPAVIACDGTISDVEVLRKSLSLSSAEGAALQQAGYRYLDTMLPRDWSHVAKLYEDALEAVDKT